MLLALFCSFFVNLIKKSLTTRFGHTGKINPHIKSCLIQHIFRCSHQYQKRSGQKQAHKNKKRPAHQTYGYRSVDRLFYLLVPSCAIMLRHQHVCTYGQTDEYIDQQID